MKPHEEPAKSGLGAPPLAAATKELPDKSDPVLHRRACKALYLDYLGAHVLAKQTSFAITLDESAKDAAMEFVEALRESIQPRDAFEEMLVLQMVWTHARLAKLSMLAVDQEMTVNVRVVNEACDRAANTLRRQMLALAEYRRPPRQDSFVAIKQANVAAQQVVQNIEIAKVEGTNDANEQGSASGPAVPALADGAGGPTGIGASPPPVALEHGPEVGGGQGHLEPQRDATRGAERANSGGPAGASGGAAGRRRRRKQ